ncbi:E3 ubiquitin-protein ligase MIB2-like [Littorina saxatilis]
MVDMLLEAGADPLLVDPKCHTYIHIAAAFDLPRSIRAFTARGVDVNIKDDFEDTALHVAIGKFKHKSVEALVQLDSVDLGVRNKNGFPFLHLACLRGNARAAELIVERDKSSVNEWYHGKSTPLHIAANNDHDECIRVLALSGGAKLNLQDNAGACYAPLHLASIKANFKAVEAFLEMGADVHVQDRDGDTPLHLSIGGRQEDNIESEAGRQECQLRVAIACMLISNGAYVDVENRKGRNPLSYGVHPVREGVRRFVEHNPELVKRKGGGSSSYGGSLQSLSNPSSLLVAKGGGDLKEALKGMGLPCGLCGAPKADITLLPCQHKCVCSTCSVNVTLCPLCDEEVKDKQVTGPDEGALDPGALEEMLEQLK